jgi:hypothetical protein
LPAGAFLRQCLWRCAKDVAAGAKQEQLFENPEHGSAAFCSDPFGHGFCLIERPKIS